MGMDQTVNRQFLGLLEDLIAALRRQLQQSTSEAEQASIQAQITKRETEHRDLLAKPIKTRFGAAFNN